MAYATIRAALAICAAVFLAAPLAQAQETTPTRVRGEIVSLSADSLTVKTKTGDKIVQIGPKLSVNAVSKATLADIKGGVFIGTTAVPQADGTLKAIEVHIFPESMRGAGEGHYAWDLLPNSSMTNASVTDMVSAVKGSTLSLKHKDGENKVTVGPDTAIVMVAPGTRDDLKAGAKVFVIASEQPDGVIKGVAVIVGRNGVKPPM